jgi:hypothetical protein
MSAGAVPSNEYLIETVVLGANAASVTFSNLAQYAGVYKHLQLIAVTRSLNTNSAVNYIKVFFNAVKTSGNYKAHFLAGNGSTVYSNHFGESDVLGLQPGTQSNTNTTGSFGPLVLDILDPFSASKNTTIRALMGNNGTASHVGLASGVFLQTAPISSIEVAPWFAGDWMTGSRFSLYGVTA